MELYKKHRPTTLDRVVGASDTVSSLRNMIARKTLPHTLLFHGPAGCGKTTLARILRTELDCHDRDFQEMNAASFRGIDSVREVARLMNQAPMRSCRIWLFDEVHKWTNDAQNAALKMLEDTPDTVYFFLCTTDPQKLIKPILTRCCEMPVRSLVATELEGLAKRIARKEDITLSAEVLDSLVINSGGSARTLLVLLDKVQNLTEEERVRAIESQAAEQNEAIALCRALIAKEPWPRVAKILKDMKGEPENIRYAVMGYARAVLLSGKSNHQAYLVLDIFKHHFYDSKEAGLTAASFEAVHAES